jgi:hypothetical protein
MSMKKIISSDAKPAQEDLGDRSKPDPRSQAKAQGLKRYFTGEPCRNGHVVERYVSNGACVECLREGVERWQKANPERLQQLARKSAQKRKDEDPGKVMATSALEAAQRRSARLKRGSAIPEGMSRKAIVEETGVLYEQARRLTKETGVVHEVDHIVPIVAGGLHHAGNLRVATRAFNMAKSSCTDLQVVHRFLEGLYEPGNAVEEKEIITTLAEQLSSLEERR